MKPTRTHVKNAYTINDGASSAGRALVSSNFLAAGEQDFGLVLVPTSLPPLDSHYTQEQKMIVSLHTDLRHRGLRISPRPEAQQFNSTQWL